MNHDIILLLLVTMKNNNFEEKRIIRSIRPFRNIPKIHGHMITGQPKTFILPLSAKSVRTFSPNFHLHFFFIVVVSTHHLHQLQEEHLYFRLQYIHSNIHDASSTPWSSPYSRSQRSHQTDGRCCTPQASSISLWPSAGLSSLDSCSAICSSATSCASPPTTSPGSRPAELWAGSFRPDGFDCSVSLSFFSYRSFFFFFFFDLFKKNSIY